MKISAKCVVVSRSHRKYIGVHQLETYNVQILQWHGSTQCIYSTSRSTRDNSARSYKYFGQYGEYLGILAKCYKALEMQLNDLG